MTTIEEFQAMLKRRGYTDSAYYPPSKLLGVKMTYTDGRHSHHAFTSQEIDLITAGPAYLIDATLGCGQHHMECSCGLPILKESISRGLTTDEYTVEGNVITLAQPLPEGMVNLEWEEYGQQVSITKANVVTAVLYRLVSAGLESEPVTHCPQCGQELALSAREIEE